MPAARILPVAQQAPVEGACCASCAAEPASVESRPARPTIFRSADRRITFGGIAVAATLLAVALGSVLLPEASRRGLWLPLHLGLAGAAGTAVAAVLPFFTAALAVAAPVRPWIRIGGIALVAGGALLVSGGVVAGAVAVSVGGGLLYVVGLGAVAVAAFMPLRGSLGPRRRLVEVAYAAAIIQVTVGVATATAMLAGFGPVIERWALLMPAHGWLNVFGFLSVVVAATLLHLAPTVAGTRIRQRATAIVAVTGLILGPPFVALGLGLASDAIARLGAVLELIGAAALVGHAVSVWRGRGRWTTDAGWHRLTGWSLTAAPAWFLVAVGIAAGRVIEHGASPTSWSLGFVAAPLALGWLAQVLIGSWSHIVPAIGPGDMTAHARQRVLLGRVASARFVALNLGVGMLTIATIAAGPDWTAVVGIALVVGSIVASLVLFGVAAAVGTVAVVPARSGGSGPIVHPADARTVEGT